MATERVGAEDLVADRRDAAVGPDGGWATKAPRHQDGFGPSAQTDRVATEVVDAAVEVHRALGPGYLESAYEAALAIELSLRGLAFDRQSTTALFYKTTKIGEHRLALLVEGRLIVEIKAVDAISAIHIAQVLAYLKATNLELSLILNFGRPTMRDGIRRIASPANRSALR